MSSSRAYTNALIARREGVSIQELDAFDYELFMYLEGVLNKQKYLSVLSNIPGYNQADKFANDVTDAFFPFKQKASQTDALKASALMEEMQQKTYTISRGPQGERLIVKDKKTT